MTAAKLFLTWAYIAAVCRWRTHTTNSYVSIERMEILNRQTLYSRWCVVEGNKSLWYSMAANARQTSWTTATVNSFIILREICLVKFIQKHNEIVRKHRRAYTNPQTVAHFRVRRSHPTCNIATNFTMFFGRISLTKPFQCFPMCYRLQIRQILDPRPRTIWVSNVWRRCKSKKKLCRKRALSKCWTDIKITTSTTHPCWKPGLNCVTGSRNLYCDRQYKPR